MQSLSSLTARCGVALAAVAALAAATPAGAAQVTWYVTGHMQALLPGTPADVAAIAPAGMAFTASFSFDSASANNPLYFTSSRTDFVTNSALGATSIDVNGNHYGSSGSSRIIEQADFNGESVTLNGGSVTGPLASTYSVALDVLNVGHSGLGTATNAQKYPWFSPFGTGGAFQMISSATPINITLSDNPATLVLFFYDSTFTNHYDRIGTIESISTTPVPEPGTWALLAAGLAATAGLVRRRQSLGA